MGDQAWRGCPHNQRAASQKDSSGGESDTSIPDASPRRCWRCGEPAFSGPSCEPCVRERDERMQRHDRVRPRKAMQRSNADVRPPQEWIRDQARRHAFQELGWTAHTRWRRRWEPKR